MTAITIMGSDMLAKKDKRCSTNIKSYFFLLDSDRSFEEKERVKKKGKEESEKERYGGEEGKE